ncbi:Toll/interleukin-1 receptor domain-containing protein [Tanacetum coccineum]
MSSNYLRDTSTSSVTPGGSTSSSSIQKKSFKYDVFISFRGEDTRKNFVDHLYHGLKDKGIYTYKDDVKIQKGKRISDDLFKSIEDSKFYIIVFSKNYASSSWCLEELGDVREAFAKHEKEQAVVKWREALKEAADLAGWELKNTNDGHEAEFIKKIVQEISLELRSINSGFDEKLVGMESRVKDVVSSLEIGIDEVRMIGIKGMGGAGKTTTARAVFDHLSNDFEARSFVENVREVSNGAGLKKLLEQVLSNVLAEKVTLDSVNDGKNMMKRRLFGKKVLLVLDDVDHIDQLEALASGPNWFKPGSRIIVTTRDEQVLVAHKVHLIRDINLLSDNEAICLFSKYAFGRENPLQGYEELSGKVVSYAAGLPLTVKVLGSFLCGKDRVEWRSLITISPEYGEYGELVLGMHDHIEEMGKNIVRREHPNEPNKHSRLWIPEEIEDILANDMGTAATRCLKLTTSKENSPIIMKGFGKMKKLQYLENYPFLYLPKTFQADNLVELEMKDSRMVQLWKKGEKKVLKKLKFLSLIQSNLTTFDFRITPNLETLSLIGSDKLKELFMPVCCQKLKHLVISGSKLITFDLGLTPNLETLSLLDCTHFVKLHVSVSCPNLKSLKLSDARLRSLDLELISNLEKLELYNCADFVELQVSAPCPNLKSLRLSDTRLRSLDLELIPNLEMLYLNDCADFVELQVSAPCPNLKFLNLSKSRLRSLDLELIPNLEMLYLNDCADFVELPPCPNLKILNLSKSRLRSLDLELIPNLERIDLARCHDALAPWSISKSINLSKSRLRSLDLELIPNLEMLELYNCAAFVELQVSVACPNLKSLILSDTRLRSLDLELIPNLERLDLNDCADFVELQVSAPCPNLKSLYLSKSRLRSLDLEHIPNLEMLYLNDCTDFDELQVSSFPLIFLNLSKSWLRSLDLELIPNLERLDLARCHELVDINAPVGCLKKVVYLNLRGCARLEKLPRDLVQCWRTHTRISYLPESIFGLEGLLQRYDFPSEITTTTESFW